MMDFRVYGYARGSTNEQEDTLAAQEEKIKQEFEARYKREGYTWGQVYVDRGVSGKIRLPNRPEGNKLLCELKKGDLLILTKLDRGFRNTRDFLEQLDHLESKGVRLRLLDLDLDTGSAMGRMMASMLAIFAEFERARISERNQESKDHRRRQGLPVGQAPWGWRNAGRRRGHKVLIKDTELRTVAAQVLQWHQAGWSIADIYIHLLKVRRSKDGSEYSEGAIVRMIATEPILQALEAKGIFYPVTISRLKAEQKEKQP